MRTSIATVSLSGPLTRKLQAAAEAGFDAVEIFENDLVTAVEPPEEIRARSAGLGLETTLYQPLRDVEAVPATRLPDARRRAERALDRAARIGAAEVLVCSNTAPWAVDDDALAAEQLSALADLAAERGLRIAYEALAWGRHVNDYAHAWRIVRAAGHPALGTCLDSFHILSRGADPAGIEAIPGERIFALQLADAPLMAMDVLQWSRHFRCFPGQGGLDVAAVLAAALRAGYAGPASLEIFNDVYRRLPPERGAVDAMRSLSVVQEQAAAVLRATPPRAASERARAVLRVPPQAPPAEGFAFVEIGAAPQRADAVRALLSGLGFVRQGAHRSKPVDLWRSGGARILCNTGTGTAEDAEIAALGLESPDPAAAVERAEALLSPVLPRVRAEGDVPLDAIAAPDGTQVFFCRTGAGRASWTGDFTAGAPADSVAAEAPDGPGAAAPERVDHVGLTQPWPHYDEAALFHRGVLGLEPSESLELADPYGLVRSRSFAGPGGGVRLALSIENVGTGADGPHLRLQHIALHTADAAAAVRAARARGVRFLPVSGNYYEDLAARFDLSAGDIAALREHGLLYDEDEHGTLVHCYTAAVGRVFFELLQRTGGYSGFGAANTPVRRAAQHAPAAAGAPAGGSPAG